MACNPFVVPNGDSVHLILPSGRELEIEATADTASVYVEVTHGRLSCVIYAEEFDPHTKKWYIVQPVSLLQRDEQ